MLGIPYGVVSNLTALCVVGSGSGVGVAVGGFEV